MTDHVSPMELSWEWGIEDTRPTVRFSWEPIGPYAGSMFDPLNRYAIQSINYRHRTLLPGCDLTLYAHFSAHLLSYNSIPEEHDSPATRIRHIFRSFVALNPGEEHPMLKAYFLPAFKAADMDQSTWALIQDSILDLPAGFPEYSSGLTLLTELLEKSPNGADFNAENTCDRLCPAKQAISEVQGQTFSRFGAQ